MVQLRWLLLCVAALGVSACGVQEAETKGADELEVGFRAQGNEPFWTVTVQEEGLFYKTPEYLDGRFIAATKQQQEAAWHYVGEWNEQSFELVVRKEACEDDMSGWAFNYSTQLTVNGATYKGCGNAVGEEYGEP